MSTTTYGWLVLAFPLLGTLITAFGYRVLPGRTAGWIGTAAIFLAFLAALGALISLQGHASEHRQIVSSLWSYASTVGIDAQMSILVDPLSVFMILVVSGVSTLIHLYSISYMDKDRGFVRYFSYLNFFVFSMLLLVLAGNFLLLIVGWAFVGAASYLLISFWYRRSTATKAGIKAFVINVVGDVGLVLGTYFIFKHTGTLNFLATFKAAPHVFHKGEADIVAGCLLLLVGAIAKSAQIPLHTWLPDAMEGPTPVSALIHAATMVTAGVYLIARMHVLFELAPAAQDTGAVIRAATLLLAAGCGHGHESSIGKGFTFIDSGGNDKKIVFNGEPPSSVVIDARVDRYTRDATKIIAARRPLVDHALTPACEYWIIDTGTRVAHRIPDAAQWPEVHCDNP